MMTPDFCHHFPIYTNSVIVPVLFSNITDKQEVDRLTQYPSARTKDNHITHVLSGLFFPIMLIWKKKKNFLYENIVGFMAGQVLLKILGNLLTLSFTVNHNKEHIVNYFMVYDSLERDV